MKPWRHARKSIEGKLSGYFVNEAARADLNVLVGNMSSTGHTSHTNI